MVAAVEVLVVVPALGVGEDVVGLVHPAARTAPSITSTSVPATNDVFMVKSRSSL